MTETTIIDHHQAIQLLRDIVAERPDYIYESPTSGTECTYTTPDGGASCIVGHAMGRVSSTVLSKVRDIEWGVDIPLPKPEVFGIDEALIGGDLHKALTNGNLSLTDDAMQVLSTAQSEQDRKKPWAEALRAAEGYYQYLVARDANRDTED